MCEKHLADKPLCGAASILSPSAADQFCKALEHIIDEECDGILFPQNHEYVCTTELVKLIAQANDKKTHTTPLFNGAIRIMARVIPQINKVFGSLAYDKSLSETFANVHHLSLEDSINEMYENH